MFIPCDHCLRRHATQVSEINEEGKAEHLRLCSDCYRKLRDSLQLSRHLAPPPVDTEAAARAADVGIAAFLQWSLIPKAVPRLPDYDLHAWFRPSQKDGGNYYDFIELQDDRLGLLVADVSCTGVQAATVMTETRALVRSEAMRTLSPAETLSRVNRVLYQDIPRGMLVTAFYAILEPKTSLLTCVSAGHCPMVLWRKASNVCHLVNPNGIALGVGKGPLFDKTVKEQKIQLAGGDRFALYTDGVTQSRNRNKEEFGQNRFYLRVKQLADRSSSEFLSGLSKEVETHQGEAPQEDDMTIVTGRVLRSP